MLRNHYPRVHVTHNITYIQRGRKDGQEVGGLSYGGGVFFPPELEGITLIIAFEVGSFVFCFPHTVLIPDSMAALAVGFTFVVCYQGRPSCDS